MSNRWSIRELVEGTKVQPSELYVYVCEPILPCVIFVQNLKSSEIYI